MAEMMKHTGNWWKEMKRKAEKNLSHLAGWDCTPKCEKEVKETLCHIMKHKGYGCAADAIEEVAEWATANLMLKYHGEPGEDPEEYGEED